MATELEIARMEHAQLMAELQAERLCHVKGKKVVYFLPNGKAARPIRNGDGSICMWQGKPVLEEKRKGRPASYMMDENENIVLDENGQPSKMQGAKEYITPEIRRQLQTELSWCLLGYNRSGDFCKLLRDTSCSIGEHFLWFGAITSVLNGETPTNKEGISLIAPEVWQACSAAVQQAAPAATEG